MFKNIVLKKFLKGTVFRLATGVNKLIPKRDDYILLYSANKGIQFNLKPLQQYLEDNHYYAHNKIVCGIESMEYAESGYHVEYKTKLKSMLFFMRAKHVFYTTGQIPIKPAKGQVVLHLQHGTTFKAAGAMSRINNGDEFFFTSCIATSAVYKDIYAQAFKCSPDNVIVNSEPVTDIFFKQYQKYDLGQYDKVILWTPTFRQSDYLGYADSGEEDLLPLFTEADYASLNARLKKLNYRLMVKIHPSQDLSKYKKLKYSNLQILSNQDFEKNGYELYNLLPQIDLLIADYSSLFLQYLLLDKPLAFVIPDIEEYKKKRGFAFTNPESLMPGPKVKTQAEFYEMLDRIDTDQVKYQVERKRVKDYIHTYSDGKSCERLIKLSKINN